MLTPAAAAHQRLLARAQSQGRILTHIRGEPDDNRTTARYHATGARVAEGESRAWNRCDLNLKANGA